MEDYQFVVHVSGPAQQDGKRWLLISPVPKILFTLVVLSVAPSMLTTLESALSEEAFSDSVINQCLISAKAEWMK